MQDHLYMPTVIAGAAEAKLSAWHVREGEAFTAGQLLAELESEKAVVELTAECAGIIEAILVPAGSDGVKAGAPIARLRAGAGATPTSAPETETVAAPPEAPRAHATRSEAVVAPVESSRVLSSPLARRLAGEAGIALEDVRGSGPSGRIVGRDIEAAVASAGPRAWPPQPDLVPLDPMRATIARRLTQAIREVPQFPLVMDVEVDALLEMRRALTAGSAREEGVTLNDCIVRAVALALRAVPQANASFTDAGIVRHPHADIAVAVALDDGLITPIIREAEEKSLVAIAREMRELVRRAKVRRLRAEEFQGGTFTVSNLGMFGVRAFGSIVSPPQACVLSVGAAEPRPVARAGELSVATVMTLTLTCDHRVLDGATGARLLAAIRERIEQPAALEGGTQG